MAKNDLEILFSDANFVAVHKPAGLATIPGRAETDSVLEALGRQLNIPSSGESDPRVRVVHRLDKDTSGVLLFALNRAAQQHVSHQFQNNTVSKEYVAIVRGHATEREGVVDAKLAPHPKSPRHMTIVKHGGRPARTDWKIEATYRGDLTLVRCFPKTGKTHQIRVHLKHAGMPLAIDPLYGQSEPLLLSSFKRDYRATRGEAERPLIDRLTLHAEKLAFDLPDGQRIGLLAPLPKDFRVTITQLSRHGHR